MPELAPIIGNRTSENSLCDNNSIIIVMNSECKLFNTWDFSPFHSSQFPFPLYLESECFHSLDCLWQRYERNCIALFELLTKQTKPNCNNSDTL